MRTPGSRDLPPPLELVCLRALWQLTEGNVREVQQALANSGRQLAYTTVMTLLERLARRGSIARRKVGRAFVYMPQVSREVLRRAALKDFIDNYFEGSEDQLMAFLTNSESARQPALVKAAVAGLDTALL